MGKAVESVGGRLEAFFFALVKLPEFISYFRDKYFLFSLFIRQYLTRFTIVSAKDGLCRYRRSVYMKGINIGWEKRVAIIPLVVFDDIKHR